MARIQLDSVSKIYSPNIVAVDSLDLQVEDGEVVVIAGPSGCGKTTLLRLVAGLEQATSGQVTWDGRAVKNGSSDPRGIAWVGDSANLFPQLSVADNVEWLRKARQTQATDSSWWERWGAWLRFAVWNWRDGGRQQTDRQRSAERSKLGEVARGLGIERLLERRPGELSAGEQQRVALGRALVIEPRLLLLDEPLARLDAPNRWRLARQLREELRRWQTTAIYVTHDRQEALTIADRVVVLRAGRVEQVGRAHDLCQRPASRFVAEWMADGRLGWLRIKRSTAAGRLANGAGEMEGDVWAGLPPGTVRVEPVTATPLSSPSATAGGQVRWVEEQGWQRFAWVELDARPDNPRFPLALAGWGASWEWVGEERTTLVAMVDQDWSGRPGDLVRLSWDWREAFWFDADSGRHLSLQELS